MKPFTERITVPFSHSIKSPTYGDVDLDCVADVELTREDCEVLAVREDAKNGQPLPDLLEMLKDGALPDVAERIETSARERVELTAAIAEVRRLLFGEDAPPAPEMPGNVRRLVARGSTGPAFGARGGVEFQVGPGALRARYEGSFPKRDLLDLDAKYDSTPKGCERRTDEEFEAATDSWRRR